LTLGFYSQIIKEYQGENFLGYAEAYSYLVAIVAAYPYAYLANNVPYGQDVVIQFGSLSFMLTGAHVGAYCVVELTTKGLLFCYYVSSSSSVSTSHNCSNCYNCSNGYNCSNSIFTTVSKDSW